MGRGIPRGIDFGSPDACECFRYAPDAGSADILKVRKSRKFLFLRENGFRKNDVFIVLKRQTAKTEMTASAMRLSGAKNVKITKGWFNETLPKQQFKNGIEILRMDAD